MTKLFNVMGKLEIHLKKCSAPSSQEQQDKTAQGQTRKLCHGFSQEGDTCKHNSVLHIIGRMGATKYDTKKSRKTQPMLELSLSL